MQSTAGTEEALTRRAAGAELPARLRAFLGARATIYYNSAQGYSDVGTITYLDPFWLELTKDSGDRLLIPVVAIRIIKLLEPAPPGSDAEMLLRPAEEKPR